MQSSPKRPPRAAGTGLVSSHRIKAQILSPSTSTCTDAGGPISRPPGRRAHSPPGTLGPPPSASPLTGRYGLSGGPCAAGTKLVPRKPTALSRIIDAARMAFDMTDLSSPCDRQLPAPARPNANSVEPDATRTSCFPPIVAVTGAAEIDAPVWKFQRTLP